MIKFKPVKFEKKIEKSLLVFILFFKLFSQTPVSAQNNSVSLDGIWFFQPNGLAQSTHVVPGFYVSDLQNSRFPNIEKNPWKILLGHPDATYWSYFNVSENMAGKKLFLHFESVNFVTDIYVNNTLAGTHAGGYLPFDIDISSLVSIPSQKNKITVKIIYNSPRFLQYGDYPIWPNGFFGYTFNLGITGSVSLQAKPAVYLSDTHITTSVKDNLITVVHEIVNCGDESSTVSLSSKINSTGMSLGSEEITIAAAETTTVTLTKSWSDPELWTPADPHLYHLVTQLQGTNSSSSDTTRFGFREFLIEGDHFTLNGIRINLRGDNVVIDSEYPHWVHFIPNKENWAVIVDSMLALNMNVIRTHMQPAPVWMLDICDEKGLMVVAESAIIGRSFPRSAEYAQNSASWCKDWIRRDRNHPCIMVWSAENEMYSTFKGNLLPAQLAEIDAAIRTQDETRPIIYEYGGDVHGLSGVTSWHYGCGYPNGWPAKGLYYVLNYWETQLAAYPLKMAFDRSKPMSYGEFEWGAGIDLSDYARKQAVKLRAYRVLGIDDIRPYRLDWMWYPVTLNIRPYNGWIPARSDVTFMQKSLSAIAIFDKNYYNRQWRPSLIDFSEGDLIDRTFVIFNDELSDKNVQLKWQVRLDGNIVEQGTKNWSIDLGTFIESNLQFTAPYTSESREFYLELNLYKGGVLKFHESIPYKTNNTGVALPQSVAAIANSLSWNTLNLSWDPVTKDQEGNDVNIDHYSVVKWDNGKISSQPLSSVNISNPSFSEDLAGVIGNPDLNVFYRLYAVDSQGRSSQPSETIAVIDYALVKTGSTNINEIGLPVELENIARASELQNFYNNINGVYYWNIEQQGVCQYIPGVESTNFNLEFGKPIIVNAVDNKTITFCGKLIKATYNFFTTDGTSFNSLMIPFEKTQITSASLLMADINGCNGVASWNAALQGFDQYIPAIPVTNFQIKPGMACYANVSEQVYWNSSQSSTSKHIMDSAKQIPQQTRTACPHAAWATHDFGSTNITFSAFIKSRPLDILRENSPGCLLNESHWLVQCASFSEQWNPGDELVITFTADNQSVVAKVNLLLTSLPADQAVDTHTAVQETSTPNKFLLNQGYPNPFNSQITIPFTISQPGKVKLQIYNLLGKPVKRLLDKDCSPGHYSLKWNGRNERGLDVTSGIYIVKLLQAKQKAQSIKIIYTR